MQALYIGLGGFLGTLLRYGVSLLLRPENGFPLSTLTVNTVGCFLIGTLYFWNQNHGGNSASYLILTTGFLGGFTTFSAFGLETFKLAQQGQILWAVGNVMANILFGFIALFIAKLLFSYA